MLYRIELTNGNIIDDHNEYANGVAEVKTFISECVPDGFKVDRIVKVFKDGRGCDVTKKYVK